MIQEFPKCLYMGADVEAEFAIVNDADEEAEARSNGFAMLDEAIDEPADLVAEAELLGIKVDKRWGPDRLAAEVAKAKGE